MAAVYLHLQNVCKAFGDEEILADISLQVREGECVGLIGPNGAGKTTLFRIIIGKETSDQGEAVVPRGVRVGYLTQDAELTPHGTVLAGLLASRTDLAEIGARMHELETAMAMPNAHEDAVVFDRWVHEHATLAERFHHLGGDTLEGDALRILRGLGLGPEYDDALMGTLSGGEKRRLALAALLLAAPDLLLLDEPTNHLDLSAIAWLEEFLRGYRGGVLIVSHDRFLLDRVANHIAEIEETRLRQFDGNYTAYHLKKTAENAMMLKRADTIERERARLAESIQRLFSHRQFTRMRSLQKQLYKLEQIQLPGEPDKTRMVFKPARKSGREVLTMREVRKRYAEAPLLEGVSFSVWRHDRAALIGPNGCGKTTLLRIITGQLGLDAGSTEFGHGVDWYYYDQEGSNLDPRNSVLREVWGDYPHLGASEVRGALARFLIFGEDVERLVGTLSGGERSRVSLAKMFLSGANLLILDEPTNHLDIDGKEALEEALADYTGTVLMVSHDRYFMDRTANRVLEIDSGAVHEYLGNYSEYLERKARRTDAPAPAPAREEAKSATGPISEPGRRSLQFRQRQLEEVEARVHALEARKVELEALLADPDLYTDGRRAKRVTDEHLKLLTDLHAVYEDWAKVSEEVMALEAEAEALRQERLARR